MYKIVDYFRISYLDICQECLWSFCLKIHTETNDAFKDSTFHFLLPHSPTNSGLTGLIVTWLRLRSIILGYTKLDVLFGTDN